MKQIILILVCIFVIIIKINAGNNFEKEKILFTLTDDTTIVGYIIEEKINEYVWIEKEDGVKVKINPSIIKSREMIKNTEKINNTQLVIETSPIIKKLTYKSPTKAALLDTIPILGLGHIYTGKWARGLLFDAGFILLTLVAGVENATGNDNSRYPLIGAIGIHVWKIFDAAHCARMNNKLLENQTSLSKPQYDVLFGYNETRKETNIGLSISF